MDTRQAKIKLVIRSLSNRAGGAERVLCDLANSLASAGYQVECLHYDPTPGKPFYPLHSTVEVVNLWVSGWRRSPQRALSLAKKLLKRGKAADLAEWLSSEGHFTWRLWRRFACQDRLLVISFLPPANTPCLVAGRLAGVPVIPTNHSVPEADYQSDTRWSQNPIDKYMRLRCLRYAARIHVLFESYRSWFGAELQPRVVAIPNYVSDRFLTQTPNSEPGATVLAVGRLDSVKNYTVLLESWALLAAEFPDWRLRIVGNGPLAETLATLAKDLGIQDSVDLVGSTHNVEAEYAGARMLVHTALFEGFGLAAAEALKSGVPVVCFDDCSGLTEFVIDGFNGLHARRDGGASALADTLKKLMEDKALTSELGRHGPESVSKFSAHAFTQKWLDLIEEALSEGDGSSP